MSVTPQKACVYQLLPPQGGGKDEITSDCPAATEQRKQRDWPGQSCARGASQQGQGSHLSAGKRVEQQGLHQAATPGGL